MRRVLLISDTHGFLDDKLLSYIDWCDVLWHGGAIGHVSVSDGIKARKPLRAVHGNVDGYELRLEFPRFLEFQCEDVRVLMTHIGGFPGRYDAVAREAIGRTCPKLFVCGHSHILRVMYDERYSMLTMNPGAIGNHGFHQVRTLLRFEINGASIENLEVIELPRFQERAD